MIELGNIHHSWGDNHVLKGIDLTVQPGETVTIIGPSGSGKSSLLRTMNHMLVPTQGTVKVDGELLSKSNARMLRKKMGMVFQHFNLFPHFTVLENITYGPKCILGLSDQEVQARAERLLEKVGLLAKRDLLPSQLSGGQKQRVAIARALAMEPSIMLFDEPTSALDPEMVKEVIEVIQSLTEEGMTIVTVTHDMQLAQKISERIVFLSAGMILEDTEAKRFFEKPQTERAQTFLSKIFF